MPRSARNRGAEGESAGLSYGNGKVGPGANTGPWIDVDANGRPIPTAPVKPAGGPAPVPTLPNLPAPEAAPEPALEPAPDPRSKRKPKAKAKASSYVSGPVPLASLVTLRYASHTATTYRRADFQFRFFYCRPLHAWTKERWHRATVVTRHQIDAPGCQHLR